jgi:hypothetical protein
VAFSLSTLESVAGTAATLSQALFAAGRWQKTAGSLIRGLLFLPHCVLALRLASVINDAGQVLWGVYLACSSDSSESARKGHLVRILFASVTWEFNDG